MSGEFTTIWKYPLEIVSGQSISMPRGSIILDVADQHGRLCLWAHVDPTQPPEDRDIEIIGTGHPISRVLEGDRVFLKTVVMGQFVWHVFERCHPFRVTKPPEEDALKWTYTSGTYDTLGTYTEIDHGDHQHRV